MRNKIFLLILLNIAGFSPIKNGLHYFIGGEACRNSDVKNCAVVGQMFSI